MSRVMRKPFFAYAKTKAQISAFVSATWIEKILYLLSLLRNFKPLAVFCGCSLRFVSDLVGNLENRFSHNEAQMTIICFNAHLANVLNVMVNFVSKTCKANKIILRRFYQILIGVAMLVAHEKTNILHMRKQRHRLAD